MGESEEALIYLPRKHEEHGKSSVYSEPSWQYSNSISNSF